MRVRVAEWCDDLKWVTHPDDVHLDQVAEMLNDPMLSVAWDRDLPGLDPQPDLSRPVVLYLPCVAAAYHTFSMFPCRIFGVGPDPHGDMALAYLGGRWQWRRNPDEMGGGS